MKKTKHLTIILLLYSIAFLASFFFYRLLGLKSFILKIIICDIFATVIIFFFSTIFKNSSIYDPYWSVAPLFIFPFFIKGVDIKTSVIAIPIAVWGIRLTANCVITFKSLDVQDWRYDYYRNKSGKLWPFVNFFGIHFMPTVIVIGVMIPGMLYLESKNGINLATWLGFLLCFLGIILEEFADRSSRKFRKQNPGKVNRVGLWKYSRHPNYLGEITFWWGIYVMMLSVEPSLYCFFVGPLANTLLFIFISIPLMEKRQLQNKPEYAAYRKETSMLLLLPPKKVKSIDAI